MLVYQRVIRSLLHSRCLDSFDWSIRWYCFVFLWLATYYHVTQSRSICLVVPAWQNRIIACGMLDQLIGASRSKNWIMLENYITNKMYQWDMQHQNDLNIPNFSGLPQQRQWPESWMLNLNFGNNLAPCLEYIWCWLKLQLSPIVSENFLVL